MASVEPSVTTAMVQTDGLKAEAGSREHARRRQQWGLGTSRSTSYCKTRYDILQITLRTQLPYIRNYRPCFRRTLTDVAAAAIDSESKACIMAFGVICSCCGEKLEREEGTADFIFTCQPCIEEPKAAAPDPSVYTIPLDTSVVVLEAAKAFSGLTDKEQSYAHALSKADWEGAKICLLQCSPEAAKIFALLQLVFAAQPVAALVEAAKSKGITDEEAEQALMYAAAFYGNVCLPVHARTAARPPPCNAPGGWHCARRWVITSHLVTQSSCLSCQRSG